MRMAIGADSNSHLSEVIIEFLKAKGIELERCGVLADKPADYVDAALEVAEKIAAGDCEKGLLFCNTGTGVTIIANKVPGVRAALCVDEYSARISRLGNNANVIVLGVRLTGEAHAREILDAWLTTEPSTEPRRVDFHRKTDEVDRRYRKSVP